VVLAPLAVIAVPLLIIAVLWWVPLWLTASHADDLSAAELLKARNDARTAAIALVVALGATGIFFYSAKTFRLSRDVRITDRYTAAVGILGADDPVAQLGALTPSNASRAILQAMCGRCCTQSAASSG
jgi:hypothetical protein